jgi:hypothetical protein
MSKSTAHENAWLALVFNASPFAGIAENDASSPATTLSVALHTADPGESGDQTTNEASYAAYARATVARSAAGWTVSGSQVVNAAAIGFPSATGGSETITHFSVGHGDDDAVLYSGSLSSPLAVSAGIAPAFAAGALVITED